MSDGSIIFDTSVDTTGINRASTMVNSSLKRMGAKIKSAFGLETVDKAAEKVTKLQQKYDASVQEVQRLGDELDKLHTRLEQIDAEAQRDSGTFIEPVEAEPYIAQAERIKTQLEDAKRKAAELNTTPEPMGKNAIKEYRAEQDKWNKAVDSLNEKYQKTLDKIELIEKKAALSAEKTRAAEIESVNAKIAKTEQRITAVKAKAEGAKISLNAALDEKKPNRFAKTLSTASAQLGRFSRRFTGIIKSALIFSVLYKALNKLKELLSSMTKQDSQIASSLENIKGNLLTAFQPIYEYCLPAIRTLLNALERATAFMAQFSAAMFGKSVSQMQKNAKALNAQASATANAGKAADKASRSLASFDEINRLEENDASESEISGAGATSFDSNIGELDGNMAKIASYSSLLLGTGLLLLGISNLNIPAIIAGIALIAAGIKVGENTGAFEDTPMWLRQIITWGTILLGAALMIYGVTRAKPFTALQGAALMGMGAAYGSSSGAFDAMPTWLTQILTWGTMLSGVALLIYGLCTQNYLAIGAGLAAIGIGIAVGSGSGIFSGIWESIKRFFSNVKVSAGEFKTSVSQTFSSLFSNIKNGVSGMWNNVKSWFSQSVAPKLTTAYWKSKFDAVKDGARASINGIISIVERGINNIVSKANKLSWDIPDWVPGVGGSHFGFNLPTVSIPRLATGTVVPKNYGEFTAILGDNKREPEVVSPISTMKQAFKEALEEAGNTSGGMMHLYLILDGKVIGETSVKYHNGVVKLTGKTPLKGV